MSPTNREGGGVLSGVGSGQALRGSGVVRKIGPGNNSALTSCAPFFIILILSSCFVKRPTIVCGLVMALYKWAELLLLIDSWRFAPRNFCGGGFSRFPLPSSIPLRHAATIGFGKNFWKFFFEGEIFCRGRTVPPSHPPPRPAPPSGLRLQWPLEGKFYEKTFLGDCFGGS